MPQPSSHPRMRGFAARASLEQVWAWIDARVSALGDESVGVFEAVGRFAAGDVVAERDLPPADRIALDGFAVRAADTVGASDYNPLPLGLSGAPLAVSVGDAPPPGTDAVVAVDQTRSVGGMMELVAAVAEGEGVERRGDDIEAGTIVVAKGRGVRVADAALLAVLCVGSVSVTRRPVVRVLPVRDEVAAGGDVDGPALAGLITRDGGIADPRPALADDVAALAETLGEGGADLILVTGGSGLGATDHSAEALALAGALEIHGVAMRPADSVALGQVGGTPVMILPGAPARALAAYEMVAGRAVRRLAGGSAGLPFPRREAVTARKIVSPGGWSDFCRVRLREDGRVEPIGSGGLASLSSLTRADGFVLVPADSEGYPAGVPVTVHLFDLAAG
ncbi:molybdopterin molybdotransferase MoeA [Skermanella stibiiresistens]|nr:molybdopterin-binding protein [Skermanella stibiiresistens]